MHALVPRRLCGLPAALLEELLVLELVDLYVQGATDLYHFLFAVAAKAPEGEIAAGTGAYQR